MAERVESKNLVANRKMKRDKSETEKAEEVRQLRGRATCDLRSLIKMNMLSNI